MPFPQELFDQLPGHCVIQSPKIHKRELDLNLGFLFRLKTLISLELPYCSIDAETIRKVFEELPFLSSFRFWFLNRDAHVRIHLPEKIGYSLEGKFIRKEKCFQSKCCDSALERMAILALLEVLMFTNRIVYEPIKLLLPSLIRFIHKWVNVY